MSNLSPKEITIATLDLYKDCLKYSYKELLRSWPIIIGALLAYISIYFVAGYVGFLGIIGSFIMSLLYIGALTLFYGWIFKAANRTKVTFDQLFDFDFNLFQGLISVAFALWILNGLLIDPIVASLKNPLIKPGINLLFAILLNPISETIAYHRYESIHALKYSINFVSTNWIEWFIPFIFISLPLFVFLDLQYIFFSIAEMQPLIPAILVYDNLMSFFSHISFSLSSIISPIALIITIFFAIFRARLFIELESGSRRQRIFKAKQN